MKNKLNELRVVDLFAGGGGLTLGFKYAGFNIVAAFDNWRPAVELYRRNFIDRMGHLAQETGTTIYAWALMANHVHILLRTGSMGLPKYMRRLLTGYALTYNHRHSRHGYLFQDRYKSRVCDEDT